MGESDIAEVSQLLQQALVADGHYPLGEHKWLDLVHGGRTGFAGFVAREPIHGPSGRLRAIRAAAMTPGVSRS